MNPLVSIIVPTYYRPERLRKALASIAEQSFRDYETIVVNDGGEDVMMVCKEFQSVKYLSYPDNRGLPAARNVGIRAARGKYIAYLDDDDWFYPFHLMTLVGAAFINKARFVYSNADAVYRDGKIRVYIDREYDPLRIKVENITPVCCVLHDRGLLDQAGLFDESLPNHEDWDLWIRMSKYTDPLHIQESTCCIDRSRATMSSNVAKMRAGYELIKARYQEAV